MPRGRRGLHVVSNNNNNTSAGIPSKEPHGLMRSDGKRPDRLTLVPWNWEGRQTSGLGRHGRMYCGWFICGSNGKGGRRSKYRAELKISKYSDLEVCLPANCSGVAWSTQWDSLSVFKGSREKDLRTVRWRERERECLPVSSFICCHSAIKRYLAP